jgi:hypothetical protein
MKLPWKNQNSNHKVFGFRCDLQLMHAVKAMAKSLGVDIMGFSEHCLHIGYAVCLMEFTDPNTRQEMQEHILLDHAKSTPMDKKTAYDDKKTLTGQALLQKYREQERQAKESMKNDLKSEIMATLNAEMGKRREEETARRKDAETWNFLSGLLKQPRKKAPVRPPIKPPIQPSEKPLKPDGDSTLPDANEIWQGPMNDPIERADGDITW